MLEKLKSIIVFGIVKKQTVKIRSWKIAEGQSRETLRDNVKFACSGEGNKECLTS